MPKKKLSDMVFQRIEPPDFKEQMSAEDLSHVIVQRVGLKRKASRADHATLLRELIKYRKDGVPITINQISSILGVSLSQTYEEIRKWRTLGMLEFVKNPTPTGDFIKGYMLGGGTTNRLLDKVESSFKSFMRQTRRIAKDFDDLLMLEMARAQKTNAKASDSPEDPAPQPEQPEPEPQPEPSQSETTQPAEIPKNTDSVQDVEEPEEPSEPQEPEGFKKDK